MHVRRQISQVYMHVKAFVMVEECETDSCIRGYHVYQDRWLPIIGERLECKSESGNPRDPYAVAVRKGGPRAQIYLNIMLAIYQAWWSCVFHSFGRAAIFERPSPRQNGNPL